MLVRSHFPLGVALTIALVFPGPALGQTHQHMSSPPDSTHEHAMPKSSAKRKPPSKRGAQPMGEMPRMDHAQMTHKMRNGDRMAMSAMYGPYPMTRCWQRHSS